MTGNWPSGHVGLILYHHPHGNWLCIVLLWMVSERHRGCMSHKSTQSFKVYSLEVQQWLHRDLRCACFQFKRLKSSISMQKWMSWNGLRLAGNDCINVWFGRENWRLQQRLVWIMNGRTLSFFPAERKAGDKKPINMFFSFTAFSSGGTARSAVWFEVGVA